MNSYEFTVFLIDSQNIQSLEHNTLQKKEKYVRKGLQIEEGDDQ